MNRIAHVAIWTRDLELMRAFYTEVLGGTSGDLYENTSTGFRSYFISFAEGSRLELMSRPDVVDHPPQPAHTHAGYAHVALSVGTRERVDEEVAALEQSGVSVVSRARVTGDGYYEAVIMDPEGNLVELTV